MIEFNIDAEKEFFLGEDKAIRFRIFRGEIQVDISTWAMECVVRKKDKDPDPPLIYKTTGDGITVEGVIGVDDGQFGIVLFESEDTEDLLKGSYRYSIKRTDPGSENVLVYGALVFLQATAHANSPEMTETV